MEDFSVVIDAFLGVKPEFQDVIAEITRKMGAGMAEFAAKKGCETVEEYNLYCHYVAGQVGHGCSRLFVASGLESEEFLKMDELYDFNVLLKGQTRWVYFSKK